MFLGLFRLLPALCSSSFVFTNRAQSYISHFHITSYWVSIYISPFLSHVGKLSCQISLKCILASSLKTLLTYLKNHSIDHNNLYSKRPSTYQNPLLRRTSRRLFSYKIIPFQTCTKVSPDIGSILVTFKHA